MAACRQGSVGGLLRSPRRRDVPIGVIHDFKYKEGAFVEGFLNPQRTFLDDHLDDFYFTQGYDELMGASRNDAKAAVTGPGGQPGCAEEDRRS